MKAKCTNPRESLRRARRRQADVARWVDAHFNQSGETFALAEDVALIPRLALDALRTVSLLVNLEGGVFEDAEWEALRCAVERLNESVSWGEEWRSDEPALPW